LATRLSKRTGLPVRTIDEVLKEVAVTASDEGAALRLALGAATAEEQAGHAARLEAAKAAADESLRVQAEALKKAKKPKKGEVVEPPGPTPEEQALAAIQQETQLTVELLARALTFRASWQDVGYGMIFDGATSCHADAATVCAAVALALPKAVVARISIGTGLPAPAGGDHALRYLGRLQDLFVAKAKELDRLVKAVRDRAAKMLEGTKERRPKMRSASPHTISPSPSIADGLADSAAAAAAAGGADDASLAPSVHTAVSASLPEAPKAVPTGDETWYDAETGGVVELAPFDVKALDDDSKKLYARQLHYQQTCQVREVEQMLGRVLAVWQPSPTGGALVTSATLEAARAARAAALAALGGDSVEDAEIAAANATAAATAAGANGGTDEPARALARKPAADDDEPVADERTLAAILQAPSPELRAILADDHIGRAAASQVGRALYTPYLGRYLTLSVPLSVPPRRWAGPRWRASTRSTSTACGRPSRPPSQRRPTSRGSWRQKQRRRPRPPPSPRRRIRTRLAAWPMAAGPAAPRGGGAPRRAARSPPSPTHSTRRKAAPSRRTGSSTWPSSARSRNAPWWPSRRPSCRRRRSPWRSCR
jgi:hypothetical protein